MELARKKSPFHSCVKWRKKRETKNKTRDRKKGGKKWRRKNKNKITGKQKNCNLYDLKIIFSLFFSLSNSIQFGTLYWRDIYEDRLFASSEIECFPSFFLQMRVKKRYHREKKKEKNRNKECHFLSVVCVTAVWKKEKSAIFERLLKGNVLMLVCPHGHSRGYTQTRTHSTFTRVHTYTYTLAIHEGTHTDKRPTTTVALH